MRSGVLLIIRRGNTILVEACPKKRIIFGWDWFLPGGKTEPNETAEDTLYREIKEELGIVVTNFTAWPEMDGTAPGETEKFVLYPFVIREYTGEIPEKILDYESPLRWIPLDEAYESPNHILATVAYRLLRNYDPS